MLFITTVQVYSVGEVRAGKRAQQQQQPMTKFLSKLNMCPDSAEANTSTSPDNTLSELPSLKCDDPLPHPLPAQFHTSSPVKQPYHSKYRSGKKSALKGHRSPGEVKGHSLTVKFGPEDYREGVSILFDDASISQARSEGEVPAVIRRQWISAHNGRGQSSEARQESNSSCKKTRDGIDVINISRHGTMTHTPVHVLQTCDGEVSDNTPSPSGEADSPTWPWPGADREVQFPVSQQIVVTPSPRKDHVSSLRPLADHVATFRPQGGQVISASAELSSPELISISEEISVEEHSVSNSPTHDQSVLGDVHGGVPPTAMTPSVGSNQGLHASILPTATTPSSSVGSNQGSVTHPSVQGLHASMPPSTGSNLGLHAATATRPTAGSGRQLEIHIPVASATNSEEDEQNISNTEVETDYNFTSYTLSFSDTD